MAPRRKTRRLQKEDSDIEDGEDAMQEGQDPVNQEQDEDPEQGPAAADDEAYERAVAAINNFRDQPLDAGADTKIKGVISDWTALLTLVKEGFDVMQDAAVAVQEVADEDQKDEPTAELDDAMRQMLDMQSDINSHKAALDEVSRAIRGGEHVNDVMERYEKSAKVKLNANRQKTARQKFAKEEVYIAFRQAIWEVDHAGEGMPIITSFLEREDGDEDSDDDDDILVGGASQNYTCPLTLRTYERPVTSNICHHTFSEAAIKDLLGQNKGTAACPFTGCKQIVTFRSFTYDKTLDKKLQAHLRREKMRAAEDEEEGGGEGIVVDDD